MFPLRTLLPQLEHPHEPQFWVFSSLHSTDRIIGYIATSYDTPDSFSLSARYMLQGSDISGSPCRLFIENNGSSMDDCHPRVITDSETLKYLETMPLSARVEGREGGVIVRIYPAE